MAVLTEMINNLVRMEFFQLLFPFLLALAIVYGVLMYVARDRLQKGPIGLISIIIAFFVMLYSSWTGSIFYTFLVNTSGVFLAIATVVLFLIIILGLIGIKDFESWTWTKGVIVLIVLFVIFLMVFGATPFGLQWGSVAFNSDLWTVIFFIVVIVVVVAVLSRSTGEGEKKEEKPS